MSSELAYAEQGGGKLTFEALPWLRFCDTKLDNVTFCQSGGVRKYALLTFPKRGFLNQPSRVEEMYERWMKLWPLNRYVAMKQFYGAIKDTDDGRAFLVVDYFPGGSLDDPRVVDSLSPTEKMIVIVGVIGQLAMLHKHGLVHCAISPARIVLDKDKRPHIVGWSEVNEPGHEMTDAHPEDCVVMPFNVNDCFRPPEIRSIGDPAYTATDIWSFAMFCLWLIDSRDPYFKSFHNIHALKAKRDASEFPCRFPISADFQELLAECLSLNYEDRPTAGWLLASLLQNQIGLNNTDWSRVREYARKNLCSEDGTETLKSFLEREDEDEYEEEEEEAALEED